MGVNATRGDNVTFASDHLGCRTDNQGDIRLHIRIASLADGGNTTVLDADIGLHNSPVIENERIGDDRINRALAAGALRLTHPVANDFPASKLQLLAIDREVLLDL